MASLAEMGPENVVTIKVVGVGGAGNNVVDKIAESKPAGVELIAVNTDRQQLANSKADKTVQIGEKLTRGQGAGSNPEVGRRSAEESRNNIAKAIEGADMVFVTAGMGGGTGTGAAPTVAEIAKETGALTVGVVTKPFGFEGKRRMSQALQGIDEMLTKVDSLLIIPNDRLKFAAEEKVTFANAFKVADNVLDSAVRSIFDLIRSTGAINLDFADVCCVMREAGFAHMGVGRAGGVNKAEEATNAAVNSPLLETTINGATGVIVAITGSSDMTLEEVEAAAGLVHDAANPEANIIFGAAYDDSMGDEMRVIVIATGFTKESSEEEEPDVKSPGTGDAGAAKKDSEITPLNFGTIKAAPSAPTTPTTTWQNPAPAAAPAQTWQNPAPAAAPQAAWQNPAPAAAPQATWQNPAPTVAPQAAWQTPAPAAAPQAAWQNPAPATPAYNAAPAYQAPTAPKQNAEEDPFDTIFRTFNQR